MVKYAHDAIVPDNSSGLSKKDQVAGMFDSIAGRYDFLNRFLSAGIDKQWRKKMLYELKELHPARLLDVATGTADVAIMASALLKTENITGIDISEKMLNIGRKKVNGLQLNGQIRLLNGDCETINFSDGSFDAVIVAYGVRNFQNLEKGLAEIKRVLRPGGRLVVLEFSKPKMPVIKQLYQLYMTVICPLAGRLLSKNKSAYRYLNNSIKKFPERKNFTLILDNLGYHKTYYKTLSLGICCIYCGEK